jgi:hypothetical protein
MFKTIAAALLATSMLNGTAFAMGGAGGGGGGMGATGTNYGQSQTEIWNWSNPQPLYPAKTFKHVHKPAQKGPAVQ